MNRVNVSPKNDKLEHNTVRGENCWCKPYVTKRKLGLFVIHNSADRREYGVPVEDPIEKLIKKKN